MAKQSVYKLDGKSPEEMKQSFVHYMGDKNATSKQIKDAANSRYVKIDTNSVVLSICKKLYSVDNIYKIADAGRVSIISEELTTLINAGGDEGEIKELKNTRSYVNKYRDFLTYCANLSEEALDSTTPYDFADDPEKPFIAEDIFNEIVELLFRKKNIILQGAPGVGKTFLAKKIAYQLIGMKKNENIEIVQFHQSYSYEDFIQGIRPTTTGEFKVRNGIFACIQDRGERRDSRRERSAGSRCPDNSYRLAGKRRQIPRKRHIGVSANRSEVLRRDGWSFACRIRPSLSVELDFDEIAAVFVIRDNAQICERRVEQCRVVEFDLDPSGLERFDVRISGNGVKRHGIGEVRRVRSFEPASSCARGITVMARDEADVRHHDRLCCLITGPVAFAVTMHRSRLEPAIIDAFAVLKFGNSVVDALLRPIPFAVGIIAGSEDEFPVCLDGKRLQVRVASGVCCVAVVCLRGGAGECGGGDNESFHLSGSPLFGKCSPQL